MTAQQAVFLQQRLRSEGVSAAIVDATAEDDFALLVSGRDGRYRVYIAPGAIGDGATLNALGEILFQERPRS